MRCVGCISCLAHRPFFIFFFFFFNDTATTEIYTLSLHDALPILLVQVGLELVQEHREFGVVELARRGDVRGIDDHGAHARSEEHTSELQSRLHLVCRLLLEKKKNKTARLLASDTRQSCIAPRPYP